MESKQRHHFAIIARAIRMGGGGDVEDGWMDGWKGGKGGKEKGDKRRRSLHCTALQGVGLMKTSDVALSRLMK